MKGATMGKDTIYIHYASHEEDSTGFEPFQIMVGNCFANNYSTKPVGLWASPVDSEYGWKDFVLAEDFGKLYHSWKFKLKKDAKILHVYKNEDILPYVVPEEKRDQESLDAKKYYLVSWHWNPNVYDDYDGVELHYCHDIESLRYGFFYSWDCDSIVIWNPNIIVEI